MVQLQAEKQAKISPRLAPDFKDLLEMKRYLPYLKNIAFKKTGTYSGNTKSAFKGRGVEFEEVRAYAFGDDLRDIDWRVTARKNTPYTKLYAEEKDREVYVFADLSPNMFFGTKKELKSVTVAKTCALIGWFVLQNKDRFGLAVFDGTQTHIFKADRRYENFFALLKELEKFCFKGLQNKEQTAENAQDQINSLRTLRQKLKDGAIVFLVGTFSNFLSQKIWTQEIKSLALKNEIYLAEVFDPLEAYAPPKGWYPAIYGNTQIILANQTKNFEAEYQAYFQQKRTELKNFCNKIQASYREIQNDLPIYAGLSPI